MVLFKRIRKFLRRLLRPNNQPSKPSRPSTPRFSPEYTRYISSDAWREKRKRRLSIDRYRCANCGSRESLQVHHLSYARLGHERMSDLVTLCRGCHNLAHGRKF